MKPTIHRPVTLGSPNAARILTESRYFGSVKVGIFGRFWFQCL